MSTERALFSETTPSSRPAARWQSVIAREPITRRRWARPSKLAAFSATYDVVVASNERISSSSFGSCVKTPTVQERAASAGRGPLLARPEVEDVAEDDVVHRAAVGDRDRDREERDPALRVQRAVDRVDDDRPATVAEASDLLADDAHVLVLEAREDHALGRRVDRRRLVAALAGADDRLALGAAWQFFEHARDVVARCAAQLEPGAHTGWNRSPEVSLG